MAEEKIRAIYIYEILGRPPEHIKTSLEQFIDKIGEMKGVKVICRKVHDPKPIDEENKNNLYTTFGEAELEMDDLNIAFNIVFHMLPASIEFLQPSEIRLKNFQIGGLLTDLAVKLHRYDEVAKGLTLENQNLQNELFELKRRFGLIKVEQVPQEKIIIENKKEVVKKGIKKSNNKKPVKKIVSKKK